VLNARNIDMLRFANIIVIIAEKRRIPIGNLRHIEEGHV